MCQPNFSKKPRSGIRIAVLIAVHNRWDLTSALLSRLAEHPADFDICIHVFNDGSSDGTKTGLASFSDITYLEGNGESFWAKSMKSAEDSVKRDIDYYLWLNNDVSLNENFFDRIRAAINLLPDSILIGQTYDPRMNQLSYGGFKRIGRHPFRLEKILAQDKYETADTFCGNIVLIPSIINLALDGIDGTFEHGYADYDFGYRAKKVGVKMNIIPGYLGNCCSNGPLEISWNMLKTLKILLSPKYLPLRSQIHFCKRHGGPEWPIYVFSPYIRTILKLKSFRSTKISAGF